MFLSAYSLMFVSTEALKILSTYALSTYAHQFLSTWLHWPVDDFFMKSVQASLTWAWHSSAQAFSVFDGAAILHVPLSTCPFPVSYAKAKTTFTVPSLVPYELLVIWGTLLINKAYPSVQGKPSEVSRTPVNMHSYLLITSKVSLAIISQFPTVHPPTHPLE